MPVEGLSASSTVWQLSEDLGVLIKNGGLNEIKSRCDESDRSSRDISLADLEGSSHESLVQQVSEVWKQLKGQISVCRKEFPCLASLMESPVTLEGCCTPLLPISSYVGLLHTPRRMAFMEHQLDPA